MRGFVPCGLRGWFYGLVGAFMDWVYYISECLTRALSSKFSGKSCVRK